MLESIICWLLGHQPSENVIELELEHLDGTVITLCERCNQMIAHDPNYGWVKW